MLHCLFTLLTKAGRVVSSWARVTSLTVMFGRRHIGHRLRHDASMKLCSWASSPFSVYYPFSPRAIRMLAGRDKPNDALKNTPYLISSLKNLVKSRPNVTMPNDRKIAAASLRWCVPWLTTCHKQCHSNRSRASPSSVV